jgi:sphingomyelin phosphodiesterase acid-like 3
MRYRNLKLFSLILVLIFQLHLAGCGGETNTAKTFPVVVFSDVHINPFYDPTLFPALVAAEPTKWANIFKISTITTPSTWGTDTNVPLLVLALSSIRQNLEASPLIIFTGDILGHKFSQMFYALYYGSQGVPDVPDATAVTAMEDFADKTVDFFTEQVRSTVGNIPVMFAVGNNDSYADQGPDSTFLANTAEYFYTNFLNGTVDHQAFLDTFKKGGYYSAEPLGTNLLVIELNTVPFSPSYPVGDTSSAVAAELAWFDSQLAQAQAAGKKVWLLIHIPPGADIYSTAQSVDNNGHIATAVMMWNQDYQASFLQILSKYPGIIALTLAGHTHMDEYRIQSSSDVIEITPSISPRSGNDPAFRVFTFSRDTLKPTDYRTLNYDLAINPEQCSNYYSFSTAYAMQGFLGDSLAQLFPALVTDNAKQALYRGDYFSGHNSPVYITNTNWPVYWCGIGKMAQQEFIDCVNAY